MLENIDFSLDDFSHFNWNEIIKSSEKQEITSYGRLFGQIADQHKNDENKNYYGMFLLLHAVCYLAITPNDKKKSFSPIYQINTSRTADISDFNDTHIALLTQIFPLIDNPEFKARIGDIIWTLHPQGNFNITLESIDAYLVSGESFFSLNDDPVGLIRIKRALQLAASLGKKKEGFQKVINRIESYIKQLTDEHGVLVSHFLDLLYAYQVGDPINNMNKAKYLAEFYENRHDWFLARGNWIRAGKWSRRVDGADTSNYYSFREKEGRCYEKEAEDNIKESENNQCIDPGMKLIIASKNLQKAIEVFRNIPGSNEDHQKSLHQKMLQLQKASRKFTKVISEKIDMTSQVEKVISIIKGKSFLEALFLYCIHWSSPGKKFLREFVEKQSSEAPLLSWISMDITNEQGRVTGRRGSLYSGTIEEIEESKNGEMHRCATQFQMANAFIIDIIRQHLQFEHHFDLEKLLEITTNNPFIPQGREIIYAEGILAGFLGNFLEALHILIPQIENSIRYLLNQNGIITTSLSSEGIQEEMDVNTLLNMPQLEVILGEDLVFDLQGVLISRFGFNFRNLLAHGLLEYQNFFSYPAIYIWWLILRICCLPLINSHTEKENNTTQPADQ